MSPKELAQSNWNSPDSTRTAQNQAVMVDLRRQILRSDAHPCCRRFTTEAAANETNTTEHRCLANSSLYIECVVCEPYRTCLTILVHKCRY